MPATATQKKAFFQCRCTNGAMRYCNCAFGGLTSVSLGLKSFFIGKLTLPTRIGVPATALVKGKLFRLSCGPPFLANAAAPPVPTRGVLVMIFFSNFRQGLCDDLLLDLDFRNMPKS